MHLPLVPASETIRQVEARVEARVESLAEAQVVAPGLGGGRSMLL